MSYIRMKGVVKSRSTLSLSALVHPFTIEHSGSEASGKGRPA